MSDPDIIVPDTQHQRFMLMLCERLGLDPKMVRADGLEVRMTSGVPLASISIELFLPTDEVVDLFNAAGRARSATDASV